LLLHKRWCICREPGTSAGIKASAECVCVGKGQRSKVGRRTAARGAEMSNILIPWATRWKHWRSCYTICIHTHTRGHLMSVCHIPRGAFLNYLCVRGRGEVNSEQDLGQRSPAIYFSIVTAWMEGAELNVHLIVFLSDPRGSESALIFLTWSNNTRFDFLPCEIFLFMVLKTLLCYWMCCCSPANETPAFGGRDVILCFVLSERCRFYIVWMMRSYGRRRRVDGVSGDVWLGWSRAVIGVWRYILFKDYNRDILKIM